MTPEQTPAVREPTPAKLLGMDIITLDLESYWDQAYSLSKLSPLEYVLSEKWQTVSCSIKLNDRPSGFLLGDAQVRSMFSKIDWSKVGVLGHNMSAFDAYVLAYRYGIRPRVWLCTLAMARPIHAKTTGLSLGKLVEHYGIGRKDNTVLLSTKGKRLEDFTPTEIADMRVYNRSDADQCWELFRRLLPLTPVKELWHIDATVRMRTEPEFVLDMPLLETAASIERDRKRKAQMDLAMMLRKGDADPTTPVRDQDIVDWSNEDAVIELVRSQLASTQQFAALLTRLGVDVPMKPSPTVPDKLVPALSKSDEAFIELQDHDDPLVAAAARVRLDVKSTLLETRIAKLQTAGTLAAGKLPVPLRYSGADTTGRDSGEEYNCVTGEHEVLTPNGWVFIRDWTPTTPIMQWWPDWRLTWCTSPDKIERMEHGDLVEFNAPFVRGRFTENHRMVTVVEKGRVRELTAGRALERTHVDRVPAAGMYEGSTRLDLTDDQLRLRVAASADATITKYHFRWGFNRQRKIDRLLALLSRTNTPFVTYDYRDRGGHFVVTVLKRHVGSWLMKGFGSWVLELSPQQMDVVLEELPLWDGMRHSRTGNTCFFSTLEAETNWVATLAHLRGYPARLGGRSNGRFDLYFRSAITTSVGRDQKRKVPGGEMVYCPRVESSYFLVRYKGAIHVTGNCQNFPRINKKNPKTSDALRRSIRAPKGYCIGVADQSGIELRVNHTLWKVRSSMALYKASPDKADLYRAFAAEQLYKCRPEDIDAVQRQVGKLAQLGLGFGAGAPTFRRIAKLQGGIDIPVTREGYDGADLTCEEIVSAWREMYSEIVDGWKACGRALEWISKGLEYPIDPWGLLNTCADGVRLPSGRIIRYPDLRQEPDGSWPDGRERTSWFYAHGRHKARLTGPKQDENDVQALARDSVFDAALDFYKESGFRPKLRVHDELVYVFPESEAQSLLDTLQAKLRTPPKWWPELIVWSEGSIADTYGDAK